MGNGATYANSSDLARPLIDFLREFFAFLRARKRLWLAPIIVAIAMVGGLLLLAQGSALAPFIYTIF